MKTYFTFLLFILTFTSAFPQQEDGKNFLHVGKDLFSVPARFDKNDWTNFSATVAATSVSFLLDKPIKDFTQSNKTPFLDGVAQIDKYYHLETMGLGIAAIYSYGLAADNEHNRKLGVCLMESTVYSILINMVVKTVMGRSRPLLEKGNVEFTPFNFDFNTTSLPSGHTTLAFAYSTVMAAEYNSFLWKFAWYGAATLVGGARIYHNVHWFSDVILGAAIGYFVGDYVNHHHTNNPNPKAKRTEWILVRVGL